MYAPMIIGQSITSHPRYHQIKNYNLKKFGLQVGDLVTINDYYKGSYGKIYKITGENLPCLDAKWGIKTIRVYKTSYYSKNNSKTTYERHTWLSKTGKSLNMNQIVGTIELTPVFSFMSDNLSKKRKVRYDFVSSKIKKIDLITLGKSFASFKEFINSEVKKIQES